MNYVIPKKPIIKELKVIQNDTQSSTVNKYCTTSSIAESVVPSIAKNQELNKIGLPNLFVLGNLGGNQLGKLIFFQKVMKKILLTSIIVPTVTIMTTTTTTKTTITTTTKTTITTTMIYYLYILFLITTIKKRK